MEISFSVVIPTFNSTNYILDTIKSIERATQESNYEIILVDDCSDDLQTLIEITKPLKNVILIQKDFKTNAADSRNIGYLKSKSRFVFFLDSDDHYLAGAIDKRIVVHRRSKAAIVFGNFITNYSRFSSPSDLPNYSSESPQEYILNMGGDFRSSVISIDKNYHQGTLFDPLSYKHQDWIFAIRCWENAENIVFDKNYLVEINVARDTRMSNSLNIKASEYFCKKYLRSPVYINAFSKTNWNSMLITQDKDACVFFISQYKPINSRDFGKLILIKSLSHPKILPLSSTLFSNLRKIKYALNSLKS